MNYVRDANWSIAILEASRNKKLLIIDDSRGSTSLAFRFLADVLEFDKNVAFTIVRNRENLSTTVSDEKFEFKSETVIAQVFG